METFKMKTGDLEPALTLRLLSDGEPLNISQAFRVTVVMRAQRGATAPKVRREAQKLDDGSLAKRGLVKLIWQEGDTDTPDTYHIEAEVEWVAGRPQTFPGNGFALMNIEADLG